jgi:hypothetical protein
MFFYRVRGLITSFSPKSLISGTLTLTKVLVALALSSAISMTVFATGASAKGTPTTSTKVIHVRASSLTGYGADDPYAWHWILNKWSGVCPASIHVYWWNNQEADVVNRKSTDPANPPRQSGPTCDFTVSRDSTNKWLFPPSSPIVSSHYAAVSDATAVVYDSYGGQFNLSHGPIEGQIPPDTTSTTSPVSATTLDPGPTTTFEVFKGWHGDYKFGHKRPNIVYAIHTGHCAGTYAYGLEHIPHKRALRAYGWIRVKPRGNKTQQRNWTCRARAQVSADIRVYGPHHRGISIRHVSASWSRFASGYPKIFESTRPYTKVGSRVYNPVVTGVRLQVQQLQRTGHNKGKGKTFGWRLVP